MLSGEIGDGGNLAALHPQPPCPGPADGAQQMRVVSAVHGGLDMLRRQNEGATVAFVGFERDVDAARFGRGPQAACFRSGFIRLAGETRPSWRRSMSIPSSPTVARDPLAPDIHFKTCDSDSDAPNEKLDDPCLLGREQLCPECAEIL